MMFLSRSILLCALATGLVACTSDEEKVAALLTAAEEYAEAGEHRSALVELKAALKLQPKNAAVNMQLADLLSETGNAEHAAYYYGEAYRLDPSNSEAALRQAPVLYASDPEAALALVNEVIDREPESSTAYVRRAELQLLDADTDAALASALTAAELAPEDPLTHRTVGLVYRARDKERRLTTKEGDAEALAAAIAAYKRALRVDVREDQYGHWYDDLQIAAAQVADPDQWDDAKKSFQRAYQQAIEIEDEDEAKNAIANVLNEAKRFAPHAGDMAFTRWVVESWVKTEPESVHAWQAMALLHEQEGGNADDAWKQALAGSPEDEGLHHAYVQHLSLSGQAEAAVAHIAGLPKEVREKPGMMALLVELHIQAGDTEAARAGADALDAAHPGDPWARLARAKFDLQQGRVDTALASLRKLSGEVERADVLRQLSVAESMAKNREAALDAANRAIELEPGATLLPHQIRIRVLAYKQDHTAVLQAIREAVRLGFPVDAEMQNFRIRSLYGLGRVDAARAVLNQFLTLDEPPVGAVILYDAYEGRNDPEGSRRYLLAASERHPDNLHLVKALVQSDLQRGQAASALARLDALDAKTGEDSRHGLRARILWVLNRRDEAEAAARIAFLEEEHFPETVDMFATIMTEQGHQEELLAMLEKAQEAGKLGAAGTWRLARLHLDRGDLDKAKTRLEEALAAAPNHLAIQNDLAYVLAESGSDIERAVELARSARGLNPNDAAVADTLGYAYLKKGLAEPAAFEFRSAIELARVNGQEVADYHYHLGQALLAQGKEPEAREAFEEALRIEPKHRNARQALADAAQAGGGAG